MSTYKNRAPELTIVGFGPAGLATAIAYEAAGKTGRITAIDPDERPGGGRFKSLGIDSNSAGGDFLVPFQHQEWPQALGSQAAKQLIESPNQSIVLSEVGRFLSTAGREITTERVAHQQDSIAAIQLSDDSSHYRLLTYEGATIEATNIVVATGADEKLLPELEDRPPSTTFFSSELLRHDRDQRVSETLAKATEFLIVGGAHSAYSTAHTILSKHPDAQVKLAKRGLTKPFFPSQQEMSRVGYEPQQSDCVCPETEKINRFDGVRGNARELFLRELAGKVPNLLSVYSVDLRTIDPATVVIQATGYTPRKPVIVDSSNKLVPYDLGKTKHGLATFIPTGSTTPLPDIHGIGLGYSTPYDGFNVYADQARAHFQDN